jgi:hypothetical protein
MRLLFLYDDDEIFLNLYIYIYVVSTMLSALHKGLHFNSPNAQFAIFFTFKSLQLKFMKR